MENLLGTILWPLRWVIEVILVGFHHLFQAIGMDPDGGPTWVLSIVALVVVVRACLIPIFVRQIKNQRKMMEIAPQMKKIQDKYKGKKDQLSREAMSRETMALYKQNGTNPLSSCLPLVIQMPVFFSLYTTLHNAQQDVAGVGLLNQNLAQSFAQASFFGAPLKSTLRGAWGDPTQLHTVVIAVTMIVLMTVSQFYTQLQIVSKNVSEETKASPMYRQQKMLMYIIPFGFVFSGLAFPLGVTFYWFTSNVWTMVQQYIIIRRMPTPGSEAAKLREERLARRGRVATVLPAVEGGAAAADIPVVKSTQRSQPVSKKRTKKR
jgi:YidC/Oxa1 family membrane protein insertase